MKSFLLTIAIPFYNGLDKITIILDHIFKNDFLNYEILIIDDCSQPDQSKGLLYLVNTKYCNGNLRYLCNVRNIGMDANFEKCIYESNGKFVWFFGQDDYVTIDNLLYCMSLLIQHDPDIVFANYSINRSWNYNSNYVFNFNRDINLGFGINDFIKISNKKLPAFLPSLIIKKNVWPSKTIISEFYGTHYIQLASFIYNLAINKKWLYIGRPLAVGEIPSSGWQNLLDNRVKYYVGFMNCLNKFKILNLANIDILIEEQINTNYLQYLLLSIDCKLENRLDLFEVLNNTEHVSYIYRLSGKLIACIPVNVLKFIYLLRKFYFSIRQYF